MISRTGRFSAPPSRQGNIRRENISKKPVTDVRLIIESCQDWVVEAVFYRWFVDNLSSGRTGVAGREGTVIKSCECEAWLMAGGSQKHLASSLLGDQVSDPDGRMMISSGVWGGECWGGGSNWQVKGRLSYS